MQTATIVALASGKDRAGIAVVRVSGPLAHTIALKLAGKQQLPARSAMTVRFLTADGEQIDHGLCLYFPAPRSFTGDDVCELHCHGSPVVVKQLIDQVIQYGARMAKPGEFCERAFLAGKIDLVQAEAIADLISAQSLRQAKGALASMQGVFSKRIHHFQHQLESIRVQIEAEINFSEQDITTATQQQLDRDLQNLHHDLEGFISAVSRAVHEQEGLRIVITGDVNAGKSSLLNYLTQNETAIVTDIPGTTRDIVWAQVTHNGHVLNISDTAGLRESSDPVEKIGIERAQGLIHRADCVWHLVDLNTATATPSALIQQARSQSQGVWVSVGSKLDLLTSEKSTAEFDCCISTANGSGIEALLEHSCAQFFNQDTPESIFSARDRHLQHLKEACSGVLRSLQQGEIELRAEELRLVQQSLSSILGEYTQDNLLDAIFRGFCLGK